MHYYMGGISTLTGELRMAETNVAHPSEVKLGRPSNLFSRSPADFKLWKEAKFWGAHYEGLLSLGAVGLSENNAFMLELTPVTLAKDFFYTRLLSGDGTVDFAFPGVVRKSALPKLLQVWELESLRWSEGPHLHLPGFPLGKWTFPWALAQPTAQPMWFMSFETHGVEQPLLRQRAGWSTLFSKKNTVRRLGCLIGPNISDLKPLIDSVLVVDANTPFRQGELDRARLVCLEAGADYFERLMLKAKPGKQYPWMPHASLLQLPPNEVSEMTL